MKLRKKTLLYSTALAIGLAVLLLAYLIFMLPSLYVDYQKQHTVDLVKRQHERVVTEGGIDQPATAIGYGGLISVELPKEGDTIRFSNAYAKGSVTVKDSKLREFLQTARSLVFRDWDKNDSMDSLRKEIEQTLQSQAKELQTYLQGVYGSGGFGEPIHLDIEGTELEAVDGSSSFQLIGKKTVMLGNEYTDPLSGNVYQGQILLTKQEDRVYLTAASQMVPTLTDILPVLGQSLPMILMVLLLAVLLASIWFSKQLIDPVIAMRHFTKMAREQAEHELQPVPVRGRDELAELSEDIYTLYQTKKDQYSRLRENSRRKEVFLRTSGHRLKTPVAAAMLLVDGMMNRVGRYADTEAYLPKVREQLTSMQKLIEDVLYLNRTDREPIPEAVAVAELAAGVANGFFTTEEVGPTVEFKGTAVWQTDGQMLEAVLDHLIGNARAYTDPQGRIVISIDEHQIRINNEPAHIDESLLPDIKEPFVTGHEQGGNHGLGLYLADYYAGLLGIQLEISNTQNGVLVCLTKKQESDDDKSEKEETK